jgi:hypothetical protein
MYHSEVRRGQPAVDDRATFEAFVAVRGRTTGDDRAAIAERFSPRSVCSSHPFEDVLAMLPRLALSLARAGALADGGEGGAAADAGDRAGGDASAFEAAARDATVASADAAAAGLDYCNINTAFWGDKEDADRLWLARSVVVDGCLGGALHGYLR